MRVAARMMSESVRHSLEDCQRVRVHLARQRERLERSDVSGREGSLAIALDTLLCTAVSRTGADMANIQVRDPESGALRILAASGFYRPFLDFFARVADVRSACGAAMARGKRSVVRDVAESPIFWGAALEVMLDARVRSVQSTPLLDASGATLGVLSTHYHRPRAFGSHELRLVDDLARQAGRLINPRMHG